MNALAVVNTLLEADEDLDPEQYAKGSAPTGDLVQGSLRDELVERGWRHIHVREEDEGEWVVEAGILDPNHRAQWEPSGARVIPAPTESPDLRMKIMRWFRAATKRAGMVVEEAKIEDLSPAYDAWDTYYDPADFEEDPGDWKVAIRFRWQPGAKFWSTASNALGYETKPYQRPPT